jgi:hypothetical protein
MSSSTIRRDRSDRPVALDLLREAVARRVEGDHVVAGTLAAEALCALERIDPPDPLALVDALLVVAVVHRDLGRYEEDERLCARALEIA